jgi:ketosteroid isomerase-like protein
MADPQAAETAFRRFVEAFGRGDLEDLRSLLADDFVGHITTADGGTREVSASEYTESVAKMDVETADLRLDLPDITRIDEGTVLAMVEVHASRRGKSLHNFSAQLARVAGDRLAELWMVEAEPAESEAFWAS